VKVEEDPVILVSHKMSPVAPLLSMQFDEGNNDIRGSPSDDLEIKTQSEHEEAMDSPAQLEKRLFEE